MISALMTALAGALYCQYQMFISPDTVSGIAISLQMVFAVIVGGLYVMLGPTVGAIITIMRLVPSQLYTDATTTLLMPSVRSLGPLTMEQMAGAIPSPLSIRESLLVVWPQVSGLIAATVVCFALSYYLFMRREIRT